jgi:hypothetical protein
MGKATGVFLILAGVGTAALVLPAVDKDAERQLAEVVRIATGAAPQAAATQSAPVFDPAKQARQQLPQQLPQQPPQQTPRIATAQQLSSETTASVSAPLPMPLSAVKPQPAQQAPSKMTADAAPAPVLVAPPQVITRNATAQPSRPGDAEARQVLARDIQRELKRVGCYEGEVSGEWNTGTRRAMKTFVDRVNAALPTEEPDHILRTMVQGHPGHACGKACPSGQTAANDGRCLPAAIVAQQTPSRTPDRNSATVRDGVAVPMDVTTATSPQVTASLPEPRLARPAAPKATWETTVAAAPTAPLPGRETRMGIGGPLQAPDKQDPVVVGPRTPQNAPSAFNTPAAAAGAIAVPGAIAALSLERADADARADAAQQKARAVALVPKPSGAPQVKPARQAALVPSTETEQRPAPVAKPDRERTRPAPVARRAEPYRYPAPSYLGIPVPKFITSFQKPERSTFNARSFEKHMRELR